MELPWKENQRNVSCIPEGRYRPALRWNRRRGWHFQIPHVPDRDGILIHPANDALRELRGCMAPVMVHTGPGQGSGSRRAMGILQATLGEILRSGKAFELIIHS
ncbi:MAG: DUF5675 family protein [Saprospiraceae bacterium]